MCIRDRSWNYLNSQVSELYDRVPDSRCETAWTGLTLEELQAELESSQSAAALLRELHTSDGILQIENTSDYGIYASLTEVIIPKLEAQIEAVKAGRLTPEKELSWETNWNLYGINELNNKLIEYSESTDTVSYTHLSLGQSDYDSLIKYNNELKAAKSEELKNMQAEFQRLTEEQENFVGSDLYLRMQENMFSLKDDIASIDIELENIKDTIVESDFSSFKKNETHLKNFADELDRVGDLLNENDFFTDKGQFTSTGLTKIALISEQMSTARQLAAEYENAIDQLGKHPVSYTHLDVYKRQEIYNGITMFLTTAAALWAWWKNNSFTKAAIAGDAYKEGYRLQNTHKEDA